MMMYPRTRFRRSGFRRRRKSNFQWIRSVENSIQVTVPPQFTLFDLLGQWRTLSNIDLNLPDMVVWRIIIRISIRISFPTVGFNESQGALISIYNDDRNQVPFNASSQPYSEKYLMWDAAFASEQFYQGTTAAVSAGENLVLYRHYDIKSHRRLVNQNDTLLMQVAPLATTQLEGVTFSQSTLMKMGR